MLKFDKDYWDTRYQEGRTGWDLKEVSPPLKDYIDQLEDTSCKILIPGAGLSYEAEYLWKKGFKKIFVVDVSKEALNLFQQRVPSFPKEHLILADFFSLEDSFDYILEQTFFCAIDPSLREAYVQKVYNLLNAGGTLAGVLFDFPLTNEGPPFGGNADLYKAYFEKYFTIKVLEPAYNSVSPRAGKELFMIAKK